MERCIRHYTEFCLHFCTPKSKQEIPSREGNSQEPVIPLSFFFAQEPKAKPHKLPL